MSNLMAFPILALAAVLETGGDALIRTGLHTAGVASKSGLILLGAIVLATYGVAVNAPPWDFGRLLGVYVVLFFLAAQAINVFAFHVALTIPIMVGGTLILAGGMVMTFWR